MTDAATDALELRQILYWRWDPIGVSDEFPLNAGEYDVYVRELLPRLEAGAGADEVAAYLTGVRRDAMGGVGSDPDDTRAVAEAVTYWFGCRDLLRSEARRPVLDR